MLFVRYTPLFCLSNQLNFYFSQVKEMLASDICQNCFCSMYLTPENNLRRLLFVNFVFNKKNFFIYRYGIAFSLPWLIMETLLTTPEKKKEH